MTPSLWTVDAHCHWSDERIGDKAAVEIPRMLAKGIRHFLLGGVSPTEWQRQSELRDLFPDQIWRAFGLHPYFVANQTPAVLEQAWSELLNHAPALEARGETGLDFRKPYLIHGKDRQRDFFRRHLSLAAQNKKPVILHVVRAHEEALQDLTPTEGMVHAFTAGPQLSKRYLDLGLHLSVGAKLLFAETQDLHETVRFMPLERLLIESDCPDQAPPRQTVHDSTTVWAIAERVAELKKLPFETVVEQTRGNLFRLLKKESP